MSSPSRGRKDSGTLELIETAKEEGIDVSAHQCLSHCRYLEFCSTSTFAFIDIRPYKVNYENVAVGGMLLFFVHELSMSLQDWSVEAGGSKDEVVEKKDESYTRLFTGQNEHHCL